MHKNLDELYEYIIADDNNKQTKKQNKKNANKSNLGNSNKKKEKGNMSNMNNTNSANSNSSFALEIDREVEEFRSKIRNDTVHANSIRKLKPKFTMEWIQLISKQ